MTQEENPKLFPSLEQPPIQEVVCGVVFESVPELDALVLGIYWDTRCKDFPKRSLQLALTDETGIGIGDFPMRALLVSEDDQFVLQLQHDRFYMNWRSRGYGYPRFSERHGRGGLLLRALDEYGRFGDFVESRLGRTLKLVRIELTKIDVLRRGEHWSDLADLSRLLPVTGVFQHIQRSASREVNLRFVERSESTIVIVHVATVRPNEAVEAVRVESRLIASQPGDDLYATFGAANAILNEAFFDLIERSELKRFGLKEEQP